MPNQDIQRTDNRELLRQHANWAAARERLLKPAEPAASAARPPRPVSPFVRAVRQQRELLEKRAIERLRRERGEGLPAKSPHWFQIVSEVAVKHGLTPAELTARCRKHHIADARAEAFYRLRTEISVMGEPMSFPAIGRRFGGLDHSTVLHGFRKHAAKLAHRDK